VTGDTPAPSDSPSASDSPAPSASTAPSTSPSAQTPADWPVYFLDSGRSGKQPDFPAFTGKLTAAWAAKLDGAVYAEPLVVHGRVIAATEGDSVYALDPTSGGTVWRQHVGTPVRLSALPCGNINPLGITGTPAYDPATNSIFVVGEVGNFHHILYALDPDSGAIRWSRGVDLPGQDPRTHQQRPALAVANGYVYIGFGGLAGDCGQYVGKEVGVPTSGQGATNVYRVPAAREGAIWSTGGPAVDSAGNLYVSVGNGSSTRRFDGTDSVLELSPDLKLVSRFAPAVWARDNAADADLGSLGPVLVPGGFVFIAGKNANGYVLRQGNLGGIGGQVSTTPVCRGFGAASRDGNVVYVPCPGVGVRQVTIADNGSAKAGWLAPGGGPPVIGGGAIWSLNYTSGVLYVIDPATGKARTSFPVGGVPHFAAPTLWNGMVFVGTTSGVRAIQAG
jgi:outer membrane protein assembly factor BamB